MIEETRNPDEDNLENDDTPAVETPDPGDVDRPVAPTGPTPEQQRPPESDLERLSKQPTEGIGESDAAEAASRSESDDVEDDDDDL